MAEKRREREWSIEIERERQPYLPPADLETLRRAVGAIEAAAMERRGIPANWDAIDSTQDALRAIIAKCEGKP